MSQFRTHHCIHTYHYQAGGKQKKGDSKEKKQKHAKKAAKEGMHKRE